MNSKYLITSPISWLLEKSDPPIRYLTLRDIFEYDNLQNEYAAICASPEMKSILKIERNGILGNKQKFNVYYKGSMWCFAEAVECGLDRRTYEITKTADFLFTRCQDESGGFIANWNPEFPTACNTGDMIKYLQLAGYDDERIDKGIHWVINHQRHDGGWLHCPIANSCDYLKLMLFNKAGNGISRESDTKVSSCFYASLACLWALQLYKKKNQVIDAVIVNGIEFFLKHKIFKNRYNIPIKPKYGWNRDFRLLGYPILAQFDILYCLILIARAGFFNDTRTGEAFNIIMSKQNKDGTWNLENAQTGMLFGNMKKQPIGQQNKWVTLNVMRLFKYSGYQELI